MDKKETNNNQEDSFSRVEELFGELAPGYSVNISRLEPAWCAGHLETVEIGDSEPLEIDHILKRWGGEKIRLRLLNSEGKYLKTATLLMRSYKPLVKGVQIFEFSQEPQKNSESNTTKEILEGLSSLLQKEKDANREIIEKIETRYSSIIEKMLNTKAETIQKTEPQNMDYFLKFAEQYKSLQGMFASDQVVMDNSGAEQIEFIKLLGGLVSGLKPENKNIGKVSLPPAPAHIIEKRKTLVDHIASLPAEKFGEIALESLAKMPIEKREMAMKSIINAITAENSENESDDDEEQVDSDIQEGNNDLDDDDEEDSEDSDTNT